MDVSDKSVKTSIVETTEMNRRQMGGEAVISHQEGWLITSIL
jgi:hypothetical protein